MTKEKAWDLAQYTARELNTAYCVVRDPASFPPEYYSYTAEYVAYSLLKGDICQHDVVVVFSAKGERVKGCSDG